ncbi:MAG: ribosomal protein S18-alanine N-acetyltransferase [Clostridiales bacterium]|nr:ribosomal protein S18-alanine N-acetyltransferase [Clostridiales bacterium]
MTTYEIRSMTENDIPQIARIEKMVFPAPWSETAFRSELHDNAMAMYLVLADEALPDEVLAYGGIWKIFDEGHITNIAVIPKAQGKKLGKMLLHAMIQWAWGNGLSHMTLEVRTDNHVAINLYKKTGFIDAGVRPGYYDDGRTDAMVMWLHRKSASSLAAAEGSADG